MIKKYSVECWILNQEQQVLLLQVAAKPGKHDAFWQPITGGIEDGETTIEAALREISEETQLELGKDDLSEVASGIIVAISPELTISKTLYLARAPHTRVSTNPHEHVAHQWLPPTEVSVALFWDSNRQTWELVDSYRKAAKASHEQ